MSRCLAKDAVIVRKNADFPEEALVVHEVKNDVFLAFPLGGGPQLQIPISDADQFNVVTEEEKYLTFEPAKFSLDGVEDFFDGWTNGFHWNGWECPYFDRESSIQVLNSMGCKWSENDEKNFFAVFFDNDEVPYLYYAEEINLTDGSKVTAYPIGSGEWIWEKV